MRVLLDSERKINQEHAARLAEIAASRRPTSDLDLIFKLAVIGTQALNFGLSPEDVLTQMAVTLEGARVA